MEGPHEGSLASVPSVVGIKSSSSSSPIEEVSEVVGHNDEVDTTSSEPGPHMRPRIMFFTVMVWAAICVVGKALCSSFSNKMFHRGGDAELCQWLIRTGEKAQEASMTRDDESPFVNYGFCSRLFIAVLVNLLGVSCWTFAVNVSPKG